MDLPPAISEGVVFLSYFSALPDKRQALKVRYRLEEVLLLCLVAMLCDCNCVSEIARFGEKRLDLLRRFSRFAYGSPCEDQLGVILASLDVQAFQTCFARWVAEVTGRSTELIAIDGKASRRSGTKGGKDALPMPSAFSARQKLVLGQVKVPEKSNEITAIPKLLDMLSIDGAVVTIRQPRLPVHSATRLPQPSTPSRRWRAETRKSSENTARKQATQPGAETLRAFHLVEWRMSVSMQEIPRSKPCTRRPAFIAIRKPGAANALCDPNIVCPVRMTA